MILEFDPTKPAGIVVQPTRQQSSEWVARDGKARLYPALTAPLAGKGHLDLVCPGEHLDALRSFLRQCGDLLISAGCPVFASAASVFYSLTGFRQYVGSEEFVALLRS
jgi:hypothetical protein